MKVPLLNFVGGPGVPLLNFRVSLLKFEGGPGSWVPESWSHFYTSTNLYGLEKPSVKNRDSKKVSSSFVSVTT